MSQVIRMPLRRAIPGNVWCRHLNIFFPALHRAEARTTADDIARCGLDPDDIEPAEWVTYDLAPERLQFIGSVSWEEVSHIREDDRKDSLVIRYHPSLSDAHAYLCAHADLTDDPDDEFGYEGGLYQTDAGIFTMVSRATLPRWPGPLVLY